MITTEKQRNDHVAALLKSHARDYRRTTVATLMSPDAKEYLAEMANAAEYWAEYIRTMPHERTTP